MTEQSRTPLTDAPAIETSVIESNQGYVRAALPAKYHHMFDLLVRMAKERNELELSNARLTAELATYKEAKVPPPPERFGVSPDGYGGREGIPVVWAEDYDALLLALRKVQVDVIDSVERRVRAYEEAKVPEEPEEVLCVRRSDEFGEDITLGGADCAWIVKYIDALLLALRKAQVDLERYLEALAFYADPDTYFAIGFFPDPPCGDFMQDFAIPSTEWSEYDAANKIYRAGKRAREAIDAARGQHD